MKDKGSVFCGIMATLLLAGCGKSTGNASPRVWHQAVYAGECSPEFTGCFEKVEEALPMLEETHTAAYLAIPSWKIGDAELASLLESARDRGVEVRAWILVPFESGYWPNETNVDEFTQAVKDFVQWSNDEGFGISWIVVDMEAAYDYTMRYSQLLSAGEFDQAIELMKNHVNPDEYQKNKAKFASLIDFLHGKGWKVLCVTYPQILDDLKDGDEGIQDALDVPVTGLEWDNVSFMVYLTMFQDFVDTPLKGQLVYSYSRDAWHQFGSKAGMALGVVGAGGFLEGTAVYQTSEDLHRDFVAAMAGGAFEIQVYSLEGILGMSEPRDWLDIYSLLPVPPEREPAADLIRSLMASLDREL